MNRVLAALVVALLGPTVLTYTDYNLNDVKSSPEWLMFIRYDKKYLCSEKKNIFYKKVSEGRCKWYVNYTHNKGYTLTNINGYVLVGNRENKKAFLSPSMSHKAYWSISYVLSQYLIRSRWNGYFLREDRKMRYNANQERTRWKISGMKKESPILSEYYTYTFKGYFGKYLSSFFGVALDMSSSLYQSNSDPVWTLDAIYEHFYIIRDSRKMNLKGNRHNRRVALTSDTGPTAQWSIIRKRKKGRWGWKGCKYAIRNRFYGTYIRDKKGRYADNVKQCRSWERWDIRRYKRR